VPVSLYPKRRKAEDENEDEDEGCRQRRALAAKSPAVAGRQW
jgi:hypothetical protein